MEQSDERHFDEDMDPEQAENCFIMALRHNQPEMASSLMEAYRIEFSQCGYNTVAYQVFQRACMLGRIEVVEYILSLGINKTDMGLLSYLHYIGKRDNMIELLVTHPSTDVDFANFLLGEMEHIDVGCVKILLKTGAKLFNKNHLESAIYFRRFEIVKMIFDSNHIPKENIVLSEKSRRYIEICERSRHRAAKKIQDWWIPLCYDIYRESGNRIMHSTVDRILAMSISL